MENLKEIITGKADLIFQKVVEIRRHLHENPELSFNETETASHISGLLNEMGISHKTGIAGNGIIGFIEGQKAGSNRIIALRADMDALPVAEQNDVAYKSRNEGIMHACGHDAHSASLLGTAAILNELKNEFSGTIILIFQPAEERIPGGAKLMLEEGIFDDLKPDIIIGQHVMPSMDAGTVGFKEGKYMASSDEIFITVKGKGGHAAMPYDINDTVLIASHIIVALQQIVSSTPGHPYPVFFHLVK